MVEVSQNEDFVQKTASKTAFLSITILDHPTSDWVGTQNFKGMANFHRGVLKNLEHQLRNELWARRQTSILSDRRALEIFFGVVIKKAKNRHFS